MILKFLKNKYSSINSFHLVGVWLSTLTTINLIIFVIISFYIGGDAINGKVENGHYYLYGPIKTGFKGYTEVSKSIFDYSKWHIYSIWVMIPFIIFCYLMDWRIKTKSKKIKA